MAKQADTQSNYQLINELVAYVKNLNEDVLLIGETFTDIKTSSTYLKGENSFDALFNFEFYGTLRDLYSADALETYHTEKQSKVVKDAIFDIYKRINNYIVNDKELFVFLNNHDVPRFKSPLTDNHTINRILASLTLLSPFNSTVYYGEELAVEQPENFYPLYQRGLMPWNEQKNAGFNQGTQPWVDDVTLFPWQPNFSPWSNNQQAKNNDVAQQTNNNSLLVHYQKLISLKQNDEVLSSPDRMILHPAADNVWFVEYFKEDNSRLILINLDPRADATTDIPQHMLGSYNELLQKKKYEFGSIVSLLPGRTLVLEKNN